MDPKIKLNNGVEMPILGYGVFRMDDEQTEKSVLAALKAGYRLIDTASMYGNEEAVGRAIKRSGIPREEIFVTTKLNIQEIGYDNTKEAFEHALEKLQLDYLDLYLIHAPYGDIYGSWRAMEELYRDGRIKAIGVSSFSDVQLLDFILHNDIKPAVNQVESHPFYQREADLKFMQEQGVQMEAWGPLAQGQHDLHHNSVLLEIGKKYGKSPAQVVLRSMIQREIVVIPKSTHEERIIENHDIFDFELDDKDMKRVAKLDENTSNNSAYSDVELLKAFHGIL